MIKQSQLFRSSKLLSSIRASHLALVALSAGAATTVYAQGEQLEEIQITGSRITRTTMETPTPVTTIDASELANMAPGNIIDGLSQMPMFYGNATPETTVGGQNSGGSNVNLRGAGARRTLTLLNGRRVVPSNRFGAVDVNVVPEDLLRSVESVTGGASASYGTDAVAGVVNFILDTDYEGLKTHSQTGITEYGDGRTWEVGVAGGKQVTDKIHVLGSFAAADQRRIASQDSVRDRDFLKNWARVTNPDTNGPTELVRPWVYPTNFTRGGIIVEPTVPALNRLAFQPDGTLAPLPTAGAIGNINAGCLCLSSATPYWGVNDDSELSNEFRRYNSFVYADYEFSDNLSFFVQGIYSDNATKDRNQSIHFTGGLWQTRIYSDNAFLRPEVAALINANRPAGSQFVNYGLLTESDPTSVLDEPRMETNNQMYSLTTGFNGTLETGGFLDGWNFSGYAQYGKVKQDVDTTMAIRTDRIFLAMDAVRDASGNIVCRVNLPQFTGPIGSGGNGGIFRDCVPLNTFGGMKNISKAASDYIVDRDGKTARQWTHQENYEFVLNGDIAEGFGAGSIAGAFGASYRKEDLRQLTPDPSDEYPAQVDGTLLSWQGIMPAGIRGLVPQGSTAVPGHSGIAGLRFVPNGFLGDGNSSSVLFTSLRAIAGGFSVKEAFGEINVPLLADLPMVDYLEINTAARWAEYSGSGEVWAWKFGVNWTLNDQLRIRATQSRDVRAASLQERFDQTRGGVNVRNPWNNNLQVSAASLSGGNPNVSPEEADTTTAGFVYQPSFLEGFSASVDWYSIDINDAIAQVGSQNIVDNCRLGDATFCQYVITPTGPVTNPTTATNVIIDRVESLFINLANQRIEGVDMELGYRTDINLLGGGSEQLGARFLYSWLGENSTQNPGAIRQDVAGQISGAGLPENKVTTSLTYMNGTFTAFLQARWIDGGKLLNNWLESDRAIPLSQRPAGANLAACGANICTVDDNSIPSITYIDLRLGKTFGDNDQLEVYGNINNLLDREPNITAGAIGRTGVPSGAAVQQNLYDLLGRRYTVGVNYEF